MILTNTRDELVICPSPIFHYFSQFTFYPWHILTYLRDNSFMTWCVTVSLLREVHWSDVETRRLSQKSCMYFSYYALIVHLQLPKYFELVQVICARQKIHLSIVTVPNFLCQTDRWFSLLDLAFVAKWRAPTAKSARVWPLGTRWTTLIQNGWILFQK